MKVKFSNIVWDTDGEDVELPTEVTAQVDDDLDLDENGADFLSDGYDWLVSSFDYEILEDDTEDEDNPDSV